MRRPASSPHGPSILALALVALPLWGCITSGSMLEVTQSFEHELEGVHLERESHFRLGRLSMAVARGIVSMVPDVDDEARAMVSHIRSVEIATYRVRGGHDLDATPRIPGVEARLSRDGWVPMVRERGNREGTWVFIRTDKKDRLQGIFVVDYDGRELEIVKVHGRLDRVLAEALADDPDSAIEIFGS